MPKVTGTQYRQNRGGTFSRWMMCDVCGLTWPESLIKRQTDVHGTRKVCPECWDEPGHADAVAAGSDMSEPEVKPPWEPD